MPERRKPLEPAALDSYVGGRTSRPHGGTSRFKLEDGSCLYTLDALAEFVQYEIDGSYQTDINEYMVQPFCVVCVGLDGIGDLKEDDPEKAGSVLRAVGTAFSSFTRRCDRAARFADDLSALLRRTHPRSVRESYVPRVTEALSKAAATEGVPLTFTFGVAGHPEAAVRSVEDMLLKSLFALEEAKRLGPGSLVAYDLKTMPATVSEEAARQLARRLRLG